MDRLSKIMETKLTVSQTSKIKQDQRNDLKLDIENIIMELLSEAGLDAKKVGKELALKLDNLATKLPNGYLPVKIAVSIPSVDYNVDLEAAWYEQDQENKRQAKEDKAQAKQDKIARDKADRERRKKLKEELLEAGNMA